MTTPRALVTGGAGFIGSHMVDVLLAEGFEVRVIDNLATGHLDNLAHHRREPRLAVEQVDMCDVPAGAPVFDGVEYVFHFGGIGDIVPSIERPVEYVRANVNGTVAMLEGSRRAGVRKFVYAASSSCYGLADVPTAETAPIRPEYPYALSKYVGELSALHWAQVYGLPVVSIRMFNVYGPRVRTTGAYGAVFGVFLAQKANGRPMTIVGDGTQRRDFVYVTDVARAFLMAARSEYTGEVFNLGAGVDSVPDVSMLPRNALLVRLEDAGMAEQMIEYVCHAVLHRYREFDAYAEQQQSAEWRQRPRLSKSEFTVGILGLGVLGTAVALALAPFGFPLRGWSRTPKLLPGVATSAGGPETAPPRPRYTTWST